MYYLESNKVRVYIYCGETREHVISVWELQLFFLCPAPVFLKALKNSHTGETNSFSALMRRNSFYSSEGTR